MGRCNLARYIGLLRFALGRSVTIALCAFLFFTLACRAFFATIGKQGQ
jgi:hypothetical protein